MAINHPLDTRLPDMLRSGQRLRGIFNALPSPAIIEMCAYAGFDFVIIDNEHGCADYETTENMLRAARASGIVPVVRCFARDISRLLDMGANAVQIPMVGTAEQARELVRQVATGRRHARQRLQFARRGLRRFRWSGSHQSQQRRYCTDRHDRDA